MYTNYLTDVSNVHFLKQIMWLQNGQVDRGAVQKTLKTKIVNENESYLRLWE